MPKFMFVETIHQEKVHTVRLGTVAQPLTEADIGKPVKLIGDSAYGLCADGDAIEGVLQSVNAATQDGFKIGGIYKTGYKFADVIGGALAVGDYAVAGANPARGVKLVGSMKVKKAAAAPTGRFIARVESLGNAGTGAVGTQVCLDLG